jgi:SPX domain protein involved in polyphosphate accumulation
MGSLNYQERIERNYEVNMSPHQIVTLWHALCAFFAKYGLLPVNTITSVGTVYFDNRDYDLTRYTILNPARRMLVRLRAYENYGEAPKPIAHYWVEVKRKTKDRWNKKRFRINRTALADFFGGYDLTQNLLHDSKNDLDSKISHNLCREIQELIVTMGLRPFFLLTYKRLALQNSLERVSLDWDIQYYHVGSDVYYYDSWKYPVEQPAGKSQKTILELKYARGGHPAWIADLEKEFPIRETGFLKFVEGMGFLFKGPLKSHKEADYFLRLIKAYGGEGRPLG